MTKNNKKGFSIVTGLIILVVLALIAAAGFLVYKHTHKTTKNTNKTTSKVVTNVNPYTADPTPSIYNGWQTDASSITGVQFQYPSSWSVSVGQVSCTGAQTVMVTPPASEISSASLTGQYYLQVEKYGPVNPKVTQKSGCAADGTNFKNVHVSLIKSTDMILFGMFAPSHITFFSGNSAEYYPGQPDNAILTLENYTGNNKSFTDPGAVIANSGKSSTQSQPINFYQVSIITDTTPGQQIETPAKLNFSDNTHPLFTKTQLYNDSINIFSSFKQQ